MATESASSWHPAMMPNAADIVAPGPYEDTSNNNTVHQTTKMEEHDANDAVLNKDVEDDDEAAAWLMPEEDETTEVVESTDLPRASQITEDTPNMTPTEARAHNDENNTGADAVDSWLPNGDEGDGGALLLSHKAGRKFPEKDLEPTAQEERADDQPGEETATEEHRSSGVEDTKETKPGVKGSSFSTVAQHSSSMSFARTVSHEITFGDDDDGEWSLGRSDTDAFAFMPQSDRTNSFPAVPRMTSQSESHGGLPLPSNQALDVMEEDGKEAEIEEEEYMMRSPEADSSASWQRHGAALGHHTPSRSIGGEIAEATITAEAARFEEGLPLIPQPGAADEAPEAKFDAFGAEDVDDDDFFSQVQNQNDQQNWDGDAHPLERKSTMHFMAALDDDSPSTRQNMLGETIEEHAEESAEGVALGIPETSDAAPATEDLASKWEQAFGEDDEDFLLDDSTAENKDIDAAAFLGSDDEGLLDDTLDDPVPYSQPSQPSQPQQPPANPYAPIDSAAQQSTPYTAATPKTVHAQSPPVTTFAGSIQYGQTPAPGHAEPSKAQSFVDKSKGGYASPYDLPPDLVSKTIKPRKRPSLQQLHSEQGPAPPRSATMYSQGQPPPPSSSAPPHSAHAAPPTSPPKRTELNQKTSAPVLRSSSSFFEELPITTKPRPASRQSQRAQSPGQHAQGLLQPGPPPSTSHVVPPPATRAVPPPAPLNNQHATSQQLPDEILPPLGVTGLVSPPKANPYAALQSQPPSVAPPSSTSSRYSPAPPAQQGGGVPLSSRYSPAPSNGSRPNSSYGGVPTNSIIPHLPRTSSPLAHFESNGAGDGQHYDRRTSSSFEPRLNRVSSLPPTREVDEEEEEEAASSGNRSLSANHAAAAEIVESRYSPASPVCAARYTPPLPSASTRQAATLSPPKRINSNYAPQSAAAPLLAQSSSLPSLRAETQSPSAARKDSKSSDAGVRPSSAHAPTVPPVPKVAQSNYATVSRARGQSFVNMVPPTDGREHDPLERWRGSPVMSWGVGGTFVTTFPKSIPRYAMGQSAPVTIRTVGEVKVQNIKDLDPLQDREATFPGPLKGKSKKKEAISWLSAGIESLEKEVPDVAFHGHLSLEAKRSIERLLLWKLLRIFIEHDGVLEGSPVVDKAVRQILAPEIVESQTEGVPLFAAVQPTSPVTSMQSDGVDAGAIENIRLELLKGDHETAVWAAVDKRLWGHAMIISQTVSPNLYKQVVQEFVRKEVNYPGHNNESLAALYKVLSGNFDDCVDELVPSHARAGLQLVSTHNSAGPTKDVMEGLDKWRETLTLILSNRSSDDIRGLHALGQLLSSYGRAEAAHICFIFSRQLSVFGGLDDPKADFVLIGSDHRKQSDQFAKETEALQLSEVYEYGLTLAGGVAATAGAPHLAAYKFQHAVTLAEYGFRDKALQYCDAIASAIISQTRRSPYHHPILEGSVEDFLARLKQAPREASSSWISKPTMGKVSDSMWNRFNKFVSGDEDGNAQVGADGDNGPFARISSSPNGSRPPSTSNFDVYGSSPGYSSTAAPSGAAGAAASRYAPAPAASFPVANSNPYAPAIQGQHVAAPTLTSSTQDYDPNPHQPTYPATSTAQPQNGGYQPVVVGQAPISSGYQPYGLQESPDIHPQLTADSSNQGHQTSSYGYEPLQMAPAPEADQSQDTGGSGGFEPPSLQPYGYEPPSYQPEVEDDDAPKPRKKSFMDDDDDDIPAPRQSQDKTRAEKDRENEEMFRKAAEEDAKRAGASASSKKGWGFGGWFGGGKKADGNLGESSPGKPIKAKLGEQSSFVYDPELKRWINKKPGAENVEAKKATPPPPRGATRSVSGTPPPRAAGTPPPASGRFSVPPMGAMPSRHAAGNLSSAPSMENLAGTAPVPVGGPSTGLSPSVSTSNAGSAAPSTGPPSRPATSMSNASSIDDLLGAAAPRKAGQKKPRKSGRYIDVMAK